MSAQKQKLVLTWEKYEFFKSRIRSREPLRDSLSPRMMTSRNSESPVSFTTYAPHNSWRQRAVGGGVHFDKVTGYEKIKDKKLHRFWSWHELDFVMNFFIILSKLAEFYWYVNFSTTNCNIFFSFLFLWHGLKK